MLDSFSTYHIHALPSQISPFCILTGDPGRCELIADSLDSPSLISRNREFVLFSASILDSPITIASTGIGGPSAAIAIEELAALGAHSFIRVGTCGGISTDVRSGDIIIPSAAVRHEGTSLHYAPQEFPAAADFSLLKLLDSSARSLGISPHIGIIHSKDSFYGQHAPFRMPVAPELSAKWQAWKALGVLASEMECAALFTVASALHIRCAAVLLAVWNQERINLGFSEQNSFDINSAVSVAVNALRLLISSN